LGRGVLGRGGGVRRGRGLRLGRGGPAGEVHRVQGDRRARARGGPATTTTTRSRRRLGLRGRLRLGSPAVVLARLTGDGLDRRGVGGRSDLRGGVAVLVLLLRLGLGLLVLAAALGATLAGPAAAVAAPGVVVGDRLGVDDQAAAAAVLAGLGEDVDEAG